MRSARRSLALLVLAIAAIVLAAPASAQERRSPCAPGQPSDRPPGTPPNQPPGQPADRPVGRPSQYPAGECNLRLSRSSAARGESVTATGSGYRPASTVEVTLNSAPIALGSATTDAAGAFEHRFTVPASAALGSHTVTASGADSSGGTRTLSAALEVTDPAAAAPGSTARSNDGSTLPRTGATTAATAALGVVLVALGTFAVLGARRRHPGVQ